MKTAYGEPWLSEAAKLAFEKNWMTLWRADKLESDLCLPSNFFPVRRIYCHRDIIGPLDSAFAALSKKSLQSEIKTFDGCFNIRPIRGRTDKWSIHSFGLALDFNAAENGLGQPSKWSHGFVQAWKDAGFVWGGDFRRLDPMHFQYAENC
jgi:hypothetical protein